MEHPGSRKKDVTVPLSRFLRKHKITKCAVMVSGGVDSMMLMEGFSRLGKKPTVIHVHHHLRGKESDRDAAFVKAQAALRKLPFILIHVRPKKGSGLQERARRLRYNAVARWSVKSGIRAIFVAHHAQDQLETIAMRMVRGAGSRGLKGMDAVTVLENGLVLCRPFLDISRVSLEASAKRLKIPFITDSSNDSDAYLRNRVRHEVVEPFLLQEGDWTRSLKAWTKKRRGEYEGQMRKAEAWLKKTPFRVSSYLSLSPEIQFWIFETLLMKAGFQKQVTGRLFQEFVGLLGRTKSVIREYGPVRLVVEKEVFGFGGEKSSRSIFKIIKKEGKYVFGGQVVELRCSPSPLTPLPLGEGNQVLVDSDNVGKTTPWFPSPKGRGVRGEGRQCLCVNSKKITWPLIIRSPRPGDKFQPFGLKGHKKLSDFFIDRKIPRLERENALVLTHEDGNRIIAVIGHEIDDAYRLPDPPAFSCRFFIHHVRAAG